MKLFLVLCMGALAAAASLKQQGGNVNEALNEVAAIAAKSTSTFSAATKFVNDAIYFGEITPQTVTVVKKLLREAPASDVANFLKFVPYVRNFSPSLRSVLKNTPVDEISELISTAAVLNYLPNNGVAKLKDAGENYVASFLQDVEIIANWNKDSFSALKSEAEENTENFFGNNPSLGYVHPATVKYLTSLPAEYGWQVIGAAQTLLDNADAVTPKNVRTLLSFNENDFAALVQANAVVDALTTGAATLFRNVDSSDFATLAQNVPALLKVSPKFFKYVKYAPEAEVNALVQSVPALRNASQNQIVDAISLAVANFRKAQVNY